MDNFKDIIIDIFSDAWVGLGCLGTVIQSFVVSSDTVQHMREAGEIAPNNWSVFLPAAATAFLMICKAFVLVRGHFIKTTISMEEHKHKMKEKEDKNED